jgi:hypothetical protein
MQQLCVNRGQALVSPSGADLGLKGLAGIVGNTSLRTDT